MKTYLIFAGDSYYPAGGWNDFYGQSDTLDEAVLLVANTPSIDWWHIVDTRTSTVVQSGNR